MATVPLLPPSGSPSEDHGGTTDAQKLESAACDQLGVKAAVVWLKEAYPEASRRGASLLAASVSVDNRRWFAGRGSKGNAVDLVHLVLGLGSRGQATRLITGFVGSLLDAEKQVLAPEYAAGSAEEGFSSYPVELLPPVLGDTVREVATVRGLPAEIVASAALGVASGTLGKSLRLRSVGGMTVAANLNLLIGTPSGLGKSIAGAAIFGPVHDYERRAQTEHQRHLPSLQAALLAVQQEIASLSGIGAAPPPGDDHASERMDELRRREAELHARMAPPRFVVDDITSEALAKVMAANDGTLMSLSTEARAVLKIVGGRYRGAGSTDEDIYLKAFSGDEIRQDRISREAVATRPCLTVVWFTQLDNVALMFSKEVLTDSGFSCRFLTCQVKRFRRVSPYEEVTLSTPLVEAYERRVQELLDAYRQHHGEPYLLSAEPGARKIIIDFERDIEARKDDGDLASISAFASRYAEMAWKVALTLHAAEHGNLAHTMEVSELNAHAAVQIVRWYARQQQEILGEAEDEKDDQRLDAARKLVQATPGGTTPRLLQKAYGALFPSSDEAREALEALVREGGAFKHGIGKRPKYCPQRAPKH